MMCASGCCCGKIGFDFEVVAIEDCFNPEQIVNNLATINASKIEDCQVIFGGNFDTCFNAIRFPEALWPVLFDWVRGGGRLYLGGEHSGDFISDDNPKHEHGKCLKDMPVLNDFLGALGSSIQYKGGDYSDLDSASQQSGDFCTEAAPGEANLGSLVKVRINRFGEISGGSSLYVCNNTTYTDELTRKIPPPTKLGQKTIACIEKIGNGFVIVSGDSNLWFCGTGCGFPVALLEIDSKDMI